MNDTKQKVTKKEAIEFIRSKGWNTWYNDEYWVNPNVVEDPRRQDYTMHGMDWKSAYLYEFLELDKFKFSPIPGISMMVQGIKMFKDGKLTKEALDMFIEE